MSGSTAISKVDSLAIGNFDGMHLGHRALFERLTQNGGVCVIEHYRADMTPHIYRGRYTTFPIFFYDFDMIRDLQPKNFVDLLNRDFPLLKRIAVGEDFHFGSGRSADVSTLKSLFNGEVVVVDEVKYEDEPIHSRFIRNHLREGDIVRANAMLGHTYEVWGDPVRGQGIGGKKLVPTINLNCGRFLLPKEGVYLTSTFLENRWYPSVTFVGHRVTTDGTFAVESHIVDKKVEKPCRKVGIRWLRFIRPNRRFGSLNELKRAIERDMEIARRER